MDLSHSAMDEAINDFNLYDHINLAKSKTFAICHQHKGSVKLSYCFTCKLSLCESCTQQSNHSNHLIKNKQNYNLESSQIERLFSDLDEEFSQMIKVNPNILREKLIEKLNNHCKNLNEMVENLKFEKLQYINSLFDTLDCFTQNVGNEIDISKKTLSNFIDSYKGYIVKEKIETNDVVFLQIFDILNEGFISKKEIKSAFKKISKLHSDSENYFEEEFLKIEKFIIDLYASSKENFLNFEQALKSLNTLSTLSSNERHARLNSLSINRAEYSLGLNNFTNNKTIEVSKGLDLDFLNNHVCYDKFKENLDKNTNFIETFKEEFHKDYTKSHNTIELTSYSRNKTISLRDLSNEKVNSTSAEKLIEKNSFSKKRLSKTPLRGETKINYQMATPKEKKLFKKPLISEKRGSLNNNLKSKKIGYIKTIATFNINKVNDNQKHRDITPNKNDSKEINPKNKSKMTNELQIENTLSNETVFKMYIDSYIKWLENLLSLKKKEEEQSSSENSLKKNALSKLSSHDKIKIPNAYHYRLTNKNVAQILLSNYKNTTKFANLMMGMNDNIELAKPIEGSNEIQIYDKILRKIFKKLVPLNKSFHGYSIFPDGIRYTLINEKLYISGGREWSSEFKVFLCYDLVENKISRLQDMTCSRSYHAICSNEIDNKIYVIGGENNMNCEVYEIMSSTWKKLPCLNSPRANSSLYLFDNNFVYVICGFRTEIFKNEFLDTFERLDLLNLNEGWKLLDYKNKSGVDMKFDYTGIMSITPCQVFIYGGYLYRSMNRTIVIYDLLKNEILSLDEKILEELRKQFLKDPNFSKFFDE